MYYFNNKFFFNFLKISLLAYYRADFGTAKIQKILVRARENTIFLQYFRQGILYVKLRFFSTLRHVIKNFYAHFRQSLHGCWTRHYFFTKFAFVKRSSGIFAIGVIAAVFLLCTAQTPERRNPGYVMAITVDAQGDTIFWDEIEPVWILPRGSKFKKGDWRQYYKLVYNFNKVYPFALVGRKMMAQVDQTLEEGKISRSERNRYVKDVEKELFRLFEKDIRSMTVAQGLVLMRLVDRECGMNAYEIIKTYENGFAATFWQLVAKLFDQDLKTRYDPKGKDARIEQLVKIWDGGNWKSFYFSIFYEYPQETVIQRDTLQSEIRQRKDKAKKSTRNQE